MPIIVGISVCGMRRGENRAMKKLVLQWLEREETMRNGCSQRVDVAVAGKRRL